MSHSPSPAPAGSPAPSTSRHKATPVEKQRSQLERLLKDPTKPAFIPAAPKQKEIRPPRDMMKNVQGSSAGAGSGEFHVYKASRRREYERLKALSDESRAEQEKAEFEEKKRQREEEAEAKTAKNRAKRMKKKGRGKGDGKGGDAQAASGTAAATSGGNEPPLKKKRLVNGAVVTFRKPGDASGEESDADADDVGPIPVAESMVQDAAPIEDVPQAEGAKLTIIEDE